MNKEEFLLSIPDSISLIDALSDVALIFTKVNIMYRKKSQADLEKYICFHKELKWGVYKHEDKYFLVNIWPPKKFLGIENPTSLLKVTEVLTDAVDDSYLEKASIQGNNVFSKTSDSEKLFLEAITEYDSKQDVLKSEELVKQIKAKRKAKEEERGRVERKEEQKSTTEGIQQMKDSAKELETSKEALDEERKAANAVEVEAKKLEEFTEAVEEFTESIEGIEGDLEDLEDRGNQFSGKYYSQADLAEIEKIHPKYSELLSLFESIKESIEGIEDDIEGLEEQIEEVADVTEIAILQKKLQNLQSFFASLKESANNIKDDIKDLEDQIEKTAVAVEEVEDPRAAGEKEYKTMYMSRDSYLKGFKKNFDPELLETELNILGIQGWEMVGVAYGDGVHNKVIVFKR